MTKNKILTVSFIAGMVVCAGPAIAEKQLTADEVKALFIGKTADGTNVIKDKNYRLYTKDDSTAIHKNRKRTKEVSWKVTDDGKHCVQFRSLRCGYIVDMGDGVYHKVHDGEHINTLKNFRDGNHIED
jgi:hypothetical protein